MKTKKNKAEKKDTDMKEKSGGHGGGWEEGQYG